MWRNVIFNKSTELNALPQVFLSLNEANGLELWKRSRVLFCSQIVKWHLAARELFFCLIPYLFLEIQITGPFSCANSTKIGVTLHKPWAYTIKSGWLRGLSLFVLAGRFRSPARILSWRKCEFKAHIETCGTSTAQQKFGFQYRFIYFIHFSCLNFFTGLYCKSSITQIRNHLSSPMLKLSMKFELFNYNKSILVFWRQL